jgi:DNA topoisomerase-3
MNSDKTDTASFKVYELICRHFLASISKDAVGSETMVDLEIGGESFSFKGL